MQLGEDRYRRLQLALNALASASCFIRVDPRANALGLVHAALEYDEARGDFEKFAVPKIANHVRANLRKTLVNSNDLLPGGPECDHTGDSAPAPAHDAYAGDMLTTGTGSHTQRWTHGPEREVADVLDHARTLRLLEQARAQLDERERGALRLRSDQGLTWKHVAAAMEVSEATARRAHEAALRQLQEMLTAAGVAGR